MNSETGNFLVNISIGPVQGFVAAARRTRDFWMGSTVLSEVAKSVARWIVTNLPEERGVQLLRNDDLPPNFLDPLIFPAPENPTDLLPWDLENENSSPTDFRCTNIILAIVNPEQARMEDISAWANAARACVNRRWKEFCNRARSHALGDIRNDVWKFQFDKCDVLETYVSWTPLKVDGYKEARARVVRMLSGRKSLRDFESWDFDPNLRLPKSSLDARRETTLKEPEDRQGTIHFRAKEELDIVGVVKRADFGRDAIRYPSVSRFAFDPWLQGALFKEADLSTLQQNCRRLADKPLRVLTERSDEQASTEGDFEKFPWFKDFPYEGTPAYVNRHQELLSEAFHLVGPDKKDRRAYDLWRSRNPGADELYQLAERQLEVIANEMRELNKTLGAPSPYLAVLKADGDHVGAAISRLANLNSPDVHREFSLSQSRFASNAQAVINGQQEFTTDPNIPARQRRFHGATVYAGGDDVLCFIPIYQCLQLACWLKEAFTASITNSIQQSTRLDATLKASTLQEINNKPPTLSVGIALGHFMEPLEDLLTYADEAEKRAKNPDAKLDHGQTSRNGFAITDHPRGGASIGVRGNWDAQDSLVDRLKAWQELYIEDELPSKAPYELRACAREFNDTWRNVQSHSSALRLVATRIFARKTARTTVKGSLALLHQQIQMLTTPQDLECLACELLIAAHLAFAQQQSVGLGRSTKLGAFA